MALQTVKDQLSGPMCGHAQVEDKEAQQVSELKITTCEAWALHEDAMYIMNVAQQSQKSPFGKRENLIFLLAEVCVKVESHWFRAASIFQLCLYPSTLAFWILEEKAST